MHADRCEAMAQVWHCPNILGENTLPYAFLTQSAPIRRQAYESPSASCLKSTSSRTSLHLAARSVSKHIEQHSGNPLQGGEARCRSWCVDFMSEPSDSMVSGQIDFCRSPARELQGGQGGQTQISELRLVRARKCVTAVPTCGARCLSRYPIGPSDSDSDSACLCRHSSRTSLHLAERLISIPDHKK